MKYQYLLLLSLITGCQLTQSPTTPIIKTPTKTEKTTFVYNPSGKEQFVLKEKSKNLQKYGYDKFCNDTTSFTCNGNTLPYHKYVGMNGYFEGNKPAKTDSYGYKFYPVVLENGEKYYFVSNIRYGGKYGSLSPIITLEKHKEIKSFKKESLIPKSPVTLISSKIFDGHKYFELSNGTIIFEDKLLLIREICNKFGNNPEMAALLLDMDIKKDDIDHQFFITPKGSALRSRVELYIGLNNKTEWLRFRVTYHANRWLFVSSYKIAADSYRMQSPTLSFERDNASGDIWEWSDIAASNEYIKAANALSNAKKSIIRFQGSQYHVDVELQSDQKTSIKNTLRLFRLMKK